MATTQVIDKTQQTTSVGFEKHESPRVRSAQVSGLRLGYRDYGGFGRPIVLLHGLASSSHIWDVVGSSLSKTHRVVALDQRGHGTSDEPEAGYDFGTVTLDLAGFIDALGLHRPIIVGHSWGAHVALEFAARRPDDVSAVVLVDGGYEGLEGKTWAEIERNMAPPDLTHLTPKGLIEQVKEWEWGEFWNDYVEAEVLSLFEVDSSGKVRPRLSKASHMQILRAVWEQRLEEVYREVYCPAQIVSVLAPDASEDEVQEKRRRVEATGRKLGADIRWFKNTYHDIPLQRPAELASIIAEFITRQE